MPFIPFIGLSILIHLCVIFGHRVYSVFSRKPEMIPITSINKKTVDGIRNPSESIMPSFHFPKNIEGANTRLIGLMIISVIFTFVFSTASAIVSMGINSKFSSVVFVEKHFYIISSLFSETGLAINTLANHLITSRIF